MRASKSRPTWSVPSRCSAVPCSIHAGGDSRCRMSTVSGSYGAINGAKIAVAMMSRSTPAAPTPQRSRARRRHVAWRTVAGAPPAATTSVSSIRVGVLLAAAGGPDPRIDEPDDQIDHEVHPDDQECQEHHGALDHREVLVADRLDRERGHARPCEDGLGDDGPAQELAELQAQHRDHRNARVAK